MGDLLSGISGITDAVSQASDLLEDVPELGDLAQVAGQVGGMLGPVAGVLGKVADADPISGVVGTVIDTVGKAIGLNDSGLGLEKMQAAAGLYDPFLALSGASQLMKGIAEGKSPFGEDKAKDIDPNGQK